MVGLLDIAPLTRPVSLSGGQDLEVGGVTLEGIAHLIDAFPEVKELFAGKGTFTVESLISKVPGLAAEVIACSVGHPGEAAYIAAAKSLPVSDQMEVLEAAMDLTFAKGIRPLVDAVSRLMATASDTGIKVPASNSQKRQSRS